MNEKSFVLTADHIEAINRERRIMVQDGFGDAYFYFDSKELTEDNFRKALDARFSMVDEAPNQIDTILWCWEEGNEAGYLSRILPRRETGPSEWWDVGFDPIKSLVEGTKERGREAFYSYRIQGSHEGGDDAPVPLGPLKVQHPDWLMKTSQRPRWNFALKELRDMKLDIVRELAEMYDFDGFQIDFGRSPWVFEAGEQWKNQAKLTDFMRSFRAMLFRVAKKRGRPYLAAARVPENLMGCHFDGINVEQWIEENLIDILVLGERNANVDIEAFRQLIKDKPIKLYPSWNYEANVTAYDETAIELWRGAHANWWRQGADGMHAFNIGAFPDPERYTAIVTSTNAVGMTPFVREWKHQRRILQEVGDPKILKYKNKIFYIQLRNYGIANEPTPHVSDWQTPRSFYGLTVMFESLPAALDNAGKLDRLLTLEVADDVNAVSTMIEKITLEMLVSDPSAKDLPSNARLEKVEDKWSRIDHIPPENGIEELIEVRINNLLLGPAKVEGGWIVFPVETRQLAVGKNLVGVRITKRPTDGKEEIIIQKLELHIKYFKTVPVTKHPEQNW